MLFCQNSLLWPLTFSPKNYLSLNLEPKLNDHSCANPQLDHIALLYMQAKSQGALALKADSVQELLMAD